MLWGLRPSMPSGLGGELSAAKRENGGVCVRDRHVAFGHRLDDLKDLGALYWLGEAGCVCCEVVEPVAATILEGDDAGAQKSPPDVGEGSLGMRGNVPAFGPDVPLYVSGPTLAYA